VRGHGQINFSNLNLIRDVHNMIDKTDETGILVSLDQEKTFDRVDHQFLIEGFLPPGVGGLQFKVSEYADVATNFVENERSLFCR